MVDSWDPAVVPMNDAGFDDASTAVRTHTILASSGGTVDLSGVTVLNPSVRGEFLLLLRVSGRVALRPGWLVCRSDSGMACAGPWHPAKNVSRMPDLPEPW